MIAFYFMLLIYNRQFEYKIAYANVIPLTLILSTRVTRSYVCTLSIGALRGV